ncbi:hypothetical protein [Rhizobium leguminosarum]|uniref:hypothetical protein n=1 Tax=Rhizobium leguminosarum TaxID=384 RepID=UPI001AE5508C|nr:hypothetical protein [Rhizobium leguminosarum]MBP2447286.1 hypothetical protein [Rhizobium leguminosarum]
MLKTSEPRKTWWMAAVGFLLLFVSLYLKFQPLALHPVRSGLDPSWQAALAYGVEHHLLFGTDLVFTGGPLSSIYTKQFEPTTAFAVAIISLGIVAFLALSLGSLFSRSGNVLSLMSGWVLLSVCMISKDTLLLLVPLLGALYGFENDSKRGLPVTISCGYLSGILALAKFSTFPASILAMLLLDIVAVRRRRVPLHFLAMAAGLYTGLLISGQPLAQLPAFLIASVQVSGGYSSAMSLSAYVADLVIWLAMAVVFIVILLRDAVSRAGSMPYDILIARPLVIAGFLFVAFKAGLVRHDLHTLISWSALAMAITAVGFSSAYAGTRWKKPLILMACVCIVPSYAAVYVAYKALPFANVPSLPQQISEGLARGREFLFQPTVWLDKLKGENAASLAAIRKKTPLPALNGSVDIIQSEQSDVIGNGLDYRPRPTVQEYTSYTPELIERDRAFYEGPEAPEYLIMAPGSIDGRHPASAEGALWPLFFAKYEPFIETDRQIILRKRPTAVSGVKKQDIAVPMELGQDVPLPKTDNPVMIAVDMRPTLLGRLADLIYRPPMSQISVNYSDGSTGVYRLIPGMAGKGFLVSPLVVDPVAYLKVSSGHSDYPDLKHAQSVKIKTGIGNGLFYQSAITVTFTELDKDVLREASGGPIVENALQRDKKILPLLRMNALNGTTVSRVPEGLQAHAPTVLRLPVTPSSKISLSFGIRPGGWQDGGHTDGVCFFEMESRPSCKDVSIQPLYRPIVASR